VNAANANRMNAIKHETVQLSTQRKLFGWQPFTCRSVTAGIPPGAINFFLLVDVTTNQLFWELEQRRKRKNRLYLLRQVVTLYALMTLPTYKQLEIDG
jgi:uncharacterized protein (DUF2062 family)